VLARDEPTRTRCGPLPSWAPKIETLKKINNIDFNFQNQDQDITNYNSYNVKIKIVFSYVGRKNYDMSGKKFLFQENYNMCGKNFVCPEKIGELPPPPLCHCSFVVVFKTPVRPWVCRLDFPILLGTKRPVNLNTSLGHWHCRHHMRNNFSFRH
jgi:hypothetical protein